MRHAVELNHVAECEHLRARRPVGLLVAPRHPLRCRALSVGTWCAARRPKSPRADQSEVTSPPCAVEVGQPVRCRPVVASPGTLSVPCYNIHCHHITGESQGPGGSFLHYLSRFLSTGPQSAIEAPLLPPFAPRRFPLVRGRLPPAAPMASKPAGSVSGADAAAAGRLRAGRLTCMRQSVGIAGRVRAAAQVDVAAQVLGG